MSNIRVLKNASWIIACRVVQSVLALIIGMISARYLGPSNYGLLSYAASIVAFVVPITQLGFRNTFVEEIVSFPKKEGETVGTTILLTVASSILGIIGILAFVSITNVNEQNTFIVCGLYSISLIFQMTELIQYWFQAKLLSKYTSVVSLIAYAVVSAYKIFLLVTKKNIYWFSVATAFDYLTISAVLIVIYFKLNGQKWSFSFIRAKEMFAKSKYYILSGMMVAIFAQTDKIMLKLMIGNNENGFYSVAMSCAGMSGFVFQAIIDSFRPVIFEYKKKDEESYEKNMIRLYSVIFYLGLAQSVVFTALADFAIVFMYGAEYIPSIILLRIITWESSFSYMGSVRNIWMLAEGKQKYLLIINLLGALLNVLGNFIFIPLMGAVGAAIATVATQFFTNFVLCFAVKPIRQTSKLIIKSFNPKVIYEMIPKRRKTNE